MRIKAVVFVSALVMAVSGLANAGELSTPAGKIQIGAAGKFIYGYMPEDRETRTPPREDFTTALVDLTFSGEVTEQAGYYLEFCASFNPDTAAGSLSGPSNPGELGNIGVREAYIILKDYIPWTTIKAGTMIPPLTNYMDRRVTDLDLIQYPLMVNGSRMNAGIYGNRPPARDFSPWQQTGINLTIASPYLVKLDAGVWNGMMPNGNPNQNPTPGKALSLAMSFNPREPLNLSAGLWSEEFQPGPGITGLAPGAKRNLIIWYIWGSYQAGLLELSADYAAGQIGSYQLDTHGELQDLNWVGWQFTAGYWVRDNLEFLCRYEFLDPNTEDRVQLPQSRYDASRWLTLGVNWRLNDRAELAVNYVFKDELALKVNKGKPGEDPVAFPAVYNPKYSAQNNDLLLIQFMAWH